MSVVLVLVFLGLALFLVAQFGGKLTARNSLVWWFIFAFLFFCIVSPDRLLPLAHALGIQLVSNFVLAAMTLFLVFQAIQESSFSTRQSRQLRELVSSLAAEVFAKKLVLINTGFKKRVVIGMPCYNESDHLPFLTAAIKAFESHQHSDRFDYLFCVINDGSTDDGRSLLDQNLPHASTHHLTNVGVAGALLTAFKVAKLIDADFVVQCDSDGQHPLHLIPGLVTVADQLKCDLLIGSRYLNQNHDGSSTPLRRFGAVLISKGLRLFSLKTSITDPTSGFRVYSKKARNCLSISMPDEYPEPESIAILLQHRLKIDETPIHMEMRQTGVSSLAGWSGARFMVKVMSALVGLRLRSLFHG